MKLRIRAQTLRIRISPTELEQVRQKEKIESSIHFPNGSTLSYSLEASDQEDTKIIFEDTVIAIRLSPTDIETITDDANVGIQSMHTTAHGALDLLIEKDFTCLHPRGIEDADTFPNPNQKDIA